MSLISLNLSGREPEILAPEKRSMLESPSTPLAAAISSIFGWFTSSSPTASGELVSEMTAMQHLTVYTCVRIIAESVGSLTLRLYDRLDKGRKEAHEDSMHRLLALTPNSEMSACIFWGTVAGNLSLCGNSYAEILRNKGGSATELYPLHPLKTEPVRLPTGEIAYRTQDLRINAETGALRIIAAKDVLHFRLFSLDGLKGLGPIQQARQTIGLASAVEKFGARYFGNGSKPGGILTPKGPVSVETAQNFRTFWEQANGGENQQRVAVLPQEWSYTQIGLSPEDSQFLQTQQYTRAMIAALFRLAPHQLGSEARLSNANHEQASLQFVTDTLRPYLVLIEQEIARKLLDDDGSQFVEFDVSERLRGDYKTTMEGMAIGRQWGILSTNDCLEVLGRNPIGPEGDVRLAPVNMQNAEKLLDLEEPEPAPAPTIHVLAPPKEGAPGDQSDEAQDSPTPQTNDEPHEG